MGERVYPVRGYGRGTLQLTALALEGPARWDLGRGSSGELADRQSRPAGKDSSMRFLSRVLELVPTICILYFCVEIYTQYITVDRERMWASY